jgi:hypothetical protein
MYVDEEQKPWAELSERPENDESGLYIKNRGGNVIRVEIPVDCIAFQTGEALEVSSRCVC